MSRPIVKLNRQWMRFAVPREDMVFIGTIEQNASIGALARDLDGGYWQVNGDVLRKLNTSRIEASLRGAGGVPFRAPAAAEAAPAPAPGPAPVVIVKRRRRLSVEIPRE